MKNQLKIIAGVLLVSLVVQSIAFGNVSVLNASNFLSNPSNDQGKKKGKDHDGDKHHDNHDDKHHDKHYNGGHNNGSVSIKVDLGKELKVESHQGDNHKGKGHGNGKGNKHSYYGHPSDFGQHRAYEARNKHKHFKPKKEKEAYEGIQIIITRNNFLLIETSNKIILARQRNQARRDSGDITIVMYNNNLRLIDSFDERRATMELRLNF